METFSIVTRLVGVNPEGQEFKVLFCISAPYLKVEDYWACKVVLKGIEELETEVSGYDSWQASMQSIKLIKAVVNTFISKGGKLFVESLEEDPLTLNELFP